VWEAASEPRKGPGYEVEPTRPTYTPSDIQKLRAHSHEKT
jgi:hypothetical protein